MLSKIDIDVRELNYKLHPVSFKKHLSDGYYACVKSGYYHVDFCKFFMPDSLKVNQITLSKCGLTIHINEWAKLLNIIPTTDLLNIH